MTGEVLLDTTVAVAHLRGVATVSERLDRWLQATVLLPVGAATAERYGELKQQLALAGTPIPENDLWIAAIALEHGLPVATRDEHFNHVPGLSVLDWR